MFVVAFIRHLTNPSGVWKNLLESQFGDDSQSFVKLALWNHYHHACCTHPNASETNAGRILVVDVADNVVLL